MGYVGDKSSEYVGEKLSDLEEIYASDTIDRIKEGDEASRSYADGILASSKAYTDKKEASILSYSQALSGENTSYVDSNVSALNQEISSLKAEISTLKSELESVKEAGFTKIGRAHV